MIEHVHIRLASVEDVPVWIIGQLSLNRKIHALTVAPLTGPSPTSMVIVYAVLEMDEPVTDSPVPAIAANL
jgi:hypothetical protein